MGWFFGFKLHLVINEQGELLAFYLSPGNLDDRKPVPKLAKRLFGKLIGGAYAGGAVGAPACTEGIQCLADIGDNVVDMFDADRQADEVRCQAAGFLLLFVQLRVGRA